MIAIFWSFSKRKNSTKLPPSGGGTSVEFVYKDTSDAHNPELILSVWNDGWNYAMINGVYMFVESHSYISNTMFGVKLKIDVMATYRSYIMATSAFVEYGTNGTNELILDNRFPVSQNIHVGNSRVNFPLLDGGHSLILTVVSQSSVPDVWGGFTRTYYVTPANCVALAQLFINASEDTLQQMAALFKSPFDSVVNVRLVCANIGGALGSAENIYLGKYNTGVEGFTIENRILEGDILIPINWLYGDAWSGGQYTSIQLSIPGYGTVNINANDCFHASSLTLHYALDVYTGDIAYQVKTSVDLQYSIIASFQSCVGVDVPIAQQTGGTAASGIVGFIQGGITGAVNGAIGQSTTSRGMMGGVAGAYLDNHIEIRVIAHRPDEYNPGNIIGMPVGKVMQLNSGYVECRGASVSCPGYAGEIDEINSYLNGGAYIE